MEHPPNSKAPASEERARNDEELAGISNCVNTVSQQVFQLEQKIHEIEQFYANNPNSQRKESRNNLLRDKDKARHVTDSQSQQDGKAAAERMQDLMRQFGTIMDKITQSLDSEDVNDLHLHDSSQSAVGKPRDFNSIRKRMEAKDGSGYKHVRDIYHDVRSILKDSMKYNDVRSNAYVTANTLMDKFTEKWILLYPQIVKEEERVVEEESLKHAFHAKLAKDISSELYRADMCLNKLRELALQRCRKMSALEKVELGRALGKLSTEDLMRALDVVAEDNPTFQPDGEEIDIDLNAQSESTLWKLKYFITGVFKANPQGNQTSNDGDRNAANKDNAPVKPSRPKKSNLKRVKPQKKKSKKVGPTV